jgi:hypothetical protein
VPVRVQRVAIGYDLSIRGTGGASVGGLSSFLGLRQINKR